MGTQFGNELTYREIEWCTFPHDGGIDYTTRDGFMSMIASKHPNLIINCAGYTGKPNVDEAEKNKSECLRLNSIFPMRMATTCETLGIPWIHISSGCIYSGGKIAGKVTEDLLAPPGPYKSSDITGFTEEDEPNFSFVNPPCSFYSGTKALAEQGMAVGQGYIWRLRIPCDENHSPRNYLTKLLIY